MDPTTESPRDIDPPLPRGLVLFRPDASLEYRRRRLLFAAVVALATASVIWPIYPLFSAAFPLIFGLPLSLAWVVMAILVVFLALVWLFWREERA